MTKITAGKKGHKGIQDTYDRITEQLVFCQSMYDTLIYVGRFCPMHLGHQAMIGGVLGAFPDNHIILVGSCNEPVSIRNLFNYKDRTDFIRTVFPNARVSPMPDFKDDDTSWFKALDDLILLSGGTPEKSAFIGGCEEDVEWYFRNQRNVHIVNRFGGTTMNVSGTEIRDHIMQKNSRGLSKMVDSRIVPLVLKRFKDRWAELRAK
jgi:Cytidylyltransferase-like